MEQPPLIYICDLLYYKVLDGCDFQEAILAAKAVYKDKASKGDMIKNHQLKSIIALAGSTKKWYNKLELVSIF